MQNSDEMADSDSDPEELNYYFLLNQSISQLSFNDAVFRGLLEKVENRSKTLTKYAEMEERCDKNISLLNLIISNITHHENLPFEIDVKSVEVVLGKWHILREKIGQAANIHHIQEEMGDLKMDLSNVKSLYSTCKQFEKSVSVKLVSLKERIKKVKAFLPPGSHVFDLLDQSVAEVEQGLTSLQSLYKKTEIIDLKCLYPRKTPFFIYSTRSSGQNSPKSKLATPPPPRRSNRKWTVGCRMVVIFIMVLMGISLAVMYFLLTNCREFNKPNCREFNNPFRFSIVHGFMSPII